MLTRLELERIERWRSDPEGEQVEARAVEAERIAYGRIWAAIALAADLDVCRSVLRGDAVLARRLDAVALRRALRGAELPPAGDFVAVTLEMLDAVAEAGALEPAEARQ